MSRILVSDGTREGKVRLGFYDQVVQRGRVRSERPGKALQCIANLGSLR